MFESATPWDLSADATDIRARLTELEHERVLAVSTGLASVPSYLADLDAELRETQERYIGAAVTEIATLRGELFGAQAG